MNQSTKCRWTAAEPGVPGTLGTKIGDNIEPVLMSKSAPADGRLLSVSSDKGVYAATANARTAQTKTRSVCRKPDTIVCNRERRKPEILSIGFP